MKKALQIELLVIDLSTCRRCLPTGEQLRQAVQSLTPQAEALGIDMRLSEIVVTTPEEAKARALLTSPTIRLNGRDIAQDIRESTCASCGDLTHSTLVECREWHYRGRIYPAAPLPMLVEAITEAMLRIDDLPPLQPPPLEELPENLSRYFADRREPAASCCGGS